MRIPSRAEVDAFRGSPSTLWQRVLGVLAPAVLLGSIVFILIRWPQLPGHKSPATIMPGKSPATAAAVCCS